MLRALMWRNMVEAEMGTRSGCAVKVVLAVAVMGFLGGGIASLGLEEILKGDVPFAFVISALPLFLMACIVVGSAIGAFMCDAAKGCSRFLDYLPLRRLDRWVSRFVVGVALVMSLWVAVVWCQFLFFERAQDAFLAYMVPSRWALLWGVGAVLLWVFCASAFFSAYVSPGAYSIPAVVSPVLQA